MSIPPFFKSGSLLMLGVVGCMAQARADEPAPRVVPPTSLHRTGEAIYVREATVAAPAPPTMMGPGGGAAGGAAAKGAAMGAPEPRPPFIMTPRAALPKPKPEDAKKLLEVLSLQKACKLPLDLTVEKATLQEIVAQVRKTLGEKAPRIEVHDELPIRLSFALKDSTLHEVLETTGGLAGVNLWVLSDHLLLAPQKALTQEEASGMSGTSEQEMRRVFASLVADELVGQQGGAAAQGNGDGKVNGLLPNTKTTFETLSPESKQLLQGLVDQMNETNRSRVESFDGVLMSRLWSDWTLSPDVTVELNPAGSKSMTNGVPVDLLKISQENRSMKWATDGSSTGASFSGPTPPKPAAPVAPPVFDPSAKKS